MAPASWLLQAHLSGEELGHSSKYIDLCLTTGVDASKSKVVEAINDTFGEE